MKILNDVSGSVHLHPQVTCVLHAWALSELILLILVSSLTSTPVLPWPCIRAHSGTLMPRTSFSGIKDSYQGGDPPERKGWQGTT